MKAKARKRPDKRKIDFKMDKEIFARYKINHFLNLSIP